MSNRSNSASNSGPSRARRPKRTVNRPIRFPADDLVNYRLTHTPELAARTEEEPIPNQEQIRTMDNAIIEAEEEPLRDNRPEIRNNREGTPSPHDERNSDAIQNERNGEAIQNERNGDAIQNERNGEAIQNEIPQDEVPQIDPTATPMYAWLIKVLATWIYRRYSCITAPIRFILSMTIVRPLSFIWHFRSRQARSPALEQRIKEERKLWSIWLTSIFVAMVMAALFFFWTEFEDFVIHKLNYLYTLLWPQVVPFVGLTKGLVVHKSNYLSTVLWPQLVEFAETTKDRVIPKLTSLYTDSFNYLYIIFSSVIPMLPATNSIVNEHVSIIKSSYNIQQQDINNLWTLVNVHDAHINELFDRFDRYTSDNDQLQQGTQLSHKIQESIVAIVEDLMSNIGNPTPNAISQGLKTIFDINNTNTLTFSPEFLEHIQQDEHLQQLLRTTKHTAENVLYESVESFFMRNHHYMPNYADGSKGAFILSQNTSDSYPTALWHRAFKLFGHSHSYDDPRNTILLNNKCWTMNGNTGTLTIGLTAATIVKQLTIEMLPYDDDLELFYFEAYSLPSYPISSDKLELLGNFTFDGSVQTFDMDSVGKVPAIMIKVLETKQSASRITICNVKVFGTEN